MTNDSLSSNLVNVYVVDRGLKCSAYSDISLCFHMCTVSSTLTVLREAAKEGQRGSHF